MTTVITKTKICDRCKSQKFDPTYGEIKGYVIAVKSIQGDWCGTNKPSLDLCSNCIDQFKDWLDYYNLGYDVEHENDKDI